MRLKIYDKVEWHLHEEKDYPRKILHLKLIMEWLKRHDLLSEYGREILDLGIDRDFSLTDEMVKPSAREFLDNNYNDWLEKLKYDNPSLDFINNRWKNLN